MSVQGGSNHSYISNAELLAWMSARSGALNNEMAEAMDIADQRAEIVKRLSNIKTGLNGIDKDGGKGCQAADEMRALLEEYKDHPAAEQLAETLNPIIERLDKAEAAWIAEHPPAGEARAADHLAPPKTNSNPTDEILSKIAPGPESYAALSPKAQDVTDWQGKIQADLDKLGSDDRLALIQIQDLSSRSNQAMQLASNLIASNNEVAKTAIGNIRG